jgi:peptide/nickel transport system substrate-binding protein
VCSGPFKFADRVAQDRITLERFGAYWNKNAVHFDKVIYTPITDATVRLANLRSGQFDFIERAASSDIASIQKDSKLKFSKITEIGYQGITINTGKTERAQSQPLGQSAKVREAFELSLDRAGIVQVAMDGQATPGNQWVAPNNIYYSKNVPVPKRDLARARALLKEAGVTNPTFTLMTPTTSDSQKIAQVVQAMAKEAGFNIKIQSTEFATSLSLADKGDFDAYILGWSGRADPDGNLYNFIGCKQPSNYSGYCVTEVDALLEDTRAKLQPAERLAAYQGIATQMNKDRPLIYLYHRDWLWAYSNKLSGIREVPDGLLRVTGLKLN